MRSVGVGRRGLAFLVDLAVSVVWLVPLLDVEQGPEYLRVELAGGATVAYWAISLAYLTVMEGLWGATVGKFVTGVRVVGEDGRKVAFGAAVQRNLGRIVDVLPVLVPYLVGAIAVWRSPTRQRLGDRWAGTMVVEASAGAHVPRSTGWIPPAPMPPGGAAPEVPQPPTGAVPPPMPPPPPER